MGVEVTAKGYGQFLWVLEWLYMSIVVIITQLFIYVKTNRIVHIPKE